MRSKIITIWFILIISTFLPFCPISANAYDAAQQENTSEEKTNENSEVWYKIQANLFITPEFKNYPFDFQNLKIIIEDSKYNSSIFTYLQLTDVKGIDDRFKLSEWNIQGYSLNLEKHECHWSEEYWKKVNYTKQINRFGAILTII
jgi:hypothetical protein